MSVSGKVAIVTGGARGIGRATCIQLARQGAKVVVVDFGNEAAAESVVSEIIANGGEAMAIQADVRSAEQMAQLAATVKSSFGRIDVLVCNADSGVEAAAFAELSWDQFERQLTGELKAAFEPTKAVIPTMVAQQSGRIAEPEDVADAISFLAGDGARFLTGTYTPVTGGLTME